MKSLFVIISLVLFALPALADDGNYERSEENKPDPVLEKRCKNGSVRDHYELMQTNPFDNKGKCYRPFYLKPMQILSRSKALFVVGTSYEPFAMIDFGKDSAPTIYFSGIVRGEGAFQYQSAGGQLMTVHKFTVIKPAHKNEIR